MAETFKGIGRPTEYTADTVKTALDYLKTYEERYGHPFPSIVGLSQVLERGLNTLYVWKRDENKEEFADIMDAILEIQEMVLLYKGIKGEFNSSITALVLGKHGYHKKVDSTLSGPDGGPIQTANKTLTVTGIDSEHPDTQ